MKIEIFGAVCAVLLVANVAQATRVVGMPPPRADQVRPTPPENLRAGVVTGIRADGQQVEIGGKWFIIKAGRTQLLRNGLPVATTELSKGLSLKFTLASEVPGETALGVVYVP